MVASSWYCHPSAIVLSLLVLLRGVDGFASRSNNAFVGTSSSSLRRAAMPVSYGTGSRTVLEMKYTLVLVRHGESTWNKVRVLPQYCLSLVLYSNMASCVTTTPAVAV